MSDKSNRPSPSVSATLFKVGTQRTGNDGNTWVVKQTPKGVKRWVKDLNAVPFSAPTTPKTKNYFLLKNGVQILEEKQDSDRYFIFDLYEENIDRSEIIKLSTNITLSKGVESCTSEKYVEPTSNIEYFRLTIKLKKITTSEEVALFEDIEKTLKEWGYGHNISSSTPKTCSTTDVPPKNIQDYTKKPIQKGDVFYYYNDLNSPRFITSIDFTDNTIHYTRIDSLGDPIYEIVEIKKLKKDIEQCEAFLLRTTDGGNFYNEKSNVFLEVSSIKKNGGYDLEITEGGSPRKGGFKDTELLNMYLAMEQFRPFQVAIKSPSNSGVFNVNVIKKYDFFKRVGDDKLFYVENIESKTAPNYQNDDKIYLKTSDPIRKGSMVDYNITIEDIKEFVDTNKFEYIGEVKIGDIFSHNDAYVLVTSVGTQVYYVMTIIATGIKTTYTLSKFAFSDMIIRNDFKKVSAIPTSPAPTNKTKLNIADIVAKTSFSKGLKESMINDFKSSNFEDVWYLISDSVTTTLNNIQKNVIGFASGKNNYIQAEELAKIMVSEKQKLEGANKLSALTNVEPILGVKVNTKQHLYIYGVADIVIDDEAESEYVTNNDKTSDYRRQTFRRKFLVKGDIISYEYQGYNYESLVKDIYEKDDLFLIDLESTYNKEVETYGLYGDFADFEEIKIVQYYKLWELLNKPVLVTAKEEVVQKNQVDKELEDEIKSLNKQIADLVFLRSLLLPIDFEKKIDFGQRIAEKQKMLNELNFKLVERRLGGKDIFDELFDQSFVELKHSYTDTKGDADTDYFAPDGKRSELSDELNVMIRTPDFKLWFGDWELAYLYKNTEVKIPCSKVVNSNYEPMVVWHGTGVEFAYFKYEKFPATYFAKKKAYSDWFAKLHGGEDGYTIPFFLDIKNPLDLRHFGTRKVTSKEFFDYIFLKTGLDMDMLEVNPIFMSNSFPPNETWVYLRNNAKMLKKLSESKMNDGIMFFETNPSVPLGQEAHETEAYIIFNANQSKIASTDRGMLLLSSLKSFLLKKGGQI